MYNKNIIMFDTWLSEILKRKTYKLNCKTYEKILAYSEEIKSLMKKKVFLYTKINVSDVNIVEFYENLGFHLIETNTYFEKPIKINQELKGNCQLRFALKEDENDTVKVGRNSFVYTRFHTDPNIDKKLADKLKGDWVKNYFRGERGEWMVISLVGNKVVGFLQLINKSDNILLIDLIAVMPKYQRLGIAEDMIKYAEKNCEGFNAIEVGTQITNVPSIRLYEKLGFRFQKSSYVFHYHRLSK